MDSEKGELDYFMERALSNMGDMVKSIIELQEEIIKIKQEMSELKKACNLE